MLLLFSFLSDLVFSLCWMCFELFWNESISCTCHVLIEICTMILLTLCCCLSDLVYSLFPIFWTVFPCVCALNFESFCHVLTEFCNMILLMCCSLSDLVFLVVPCICVFNCFMCLCLVLRLIWPSLAWILHYGFAIVVLLSVWFGLLVVPHILNRFPMCLCLELCIILPYLD